MKKIIQHLITQGANETKLDQHIKELTSDALLSDAVTPRSVATLLVASTTPPGESATDYVVRIMGLRNDSGKSFGEVLKGIFEMEPSKIHIASIAICSAASWIRIKHLDGHLDEFTAPGITPKAIRHETVISGGIITAINMKLNFTTESGWKE